MPTTANLLTFAIAAAPAHGALSGFNAATGAFTYTPTAGYFGPDSFTFTATDGTNTSAAAAVSLTVVDNITPVLTNPGTQNSNEGGAINLAISATDSNNEVLTYSATGLPVGLSINTITGVITGTVANQDSGSSPYSVIVSARDSHSHNTGSASFTWNVSLDTTPPTSHVVNSIGTRQASDTFTVPVTFSDPNGPNGAPGLGVTSVDLYDSVNGGPFTLYQTLTMAPIASGTLNFSFTGQDRNTYTFHSLAHDAAGNTENKVSTLIEASTYVPDLNPPVTHVLTNSPAYSWSPFASSSFSGLTVSSYANGVFSLTFAGADPDQNTGTPAGSIAKLNVYASVDGGAFQVVGQVTGLTPNGNGVYAGSLIYNAMGDGQAHTYAFYSIGVDDQGVTQAVPATPDVTFSNIMYTTPLTVLPNPNGFVVEKYIQERSYIRYLDVNFNYSVSNNAVLQQLASGLTGPTPGAFVELLWYGENLTAGSTPKGTVNLFGSGTTATVSLTGNDLSINFGAKGITSLLTETGVSGTGSPTSAFGDGWFALGVDPTGNPSNGQVFWLTTYRLLGDATGDGMSGVTGPYTTAGTDAYVVYHAEGTAGTMLNGDINGDGAVNSTDLQEAVVAKGHAVGATAPQSFPQFQLFAGPAGPGNAVPLALPKLEALLPQAIADWRAAGLDAADVQRLKGVQLQIGNLGSSILGL